MRRRKFFSAQKRYLAIFSLVFASVLLGSCSMKYKDVDFVDASVTSFKLSGLTTLQLSLDAEIDNPNNFSFKVKNISGAIYKKGILFATFSSADVIEIEKNSKDTYSVDISAILKDPISALEIISNSSDVSPADFSVVVEGEAKKAGITIPVKKEIPLNRLLKKGFSLNKLKSYVKE